jgi:uncharacterized membrane protein
MTPATHLWAIGYDDTERAGQVRDVISRLGWDTGHGGKYLILLDIAVVVRNPDGSFTFDHKPFPGIANILGCAAVGFLAGLVLAAPLTGAIVGALVGGVGTAASAASAGIEGDFIRKVETLMKPGTSALFVLDEEGDMEIILHAIRGLGGTVLQTNVDLDRTKLIQSTLAVASADVTETAAIARLPDHARELQGRRGNHPRETDDPVTVYTLNDPYQAEIIKAVLRGEGISCELDGERQAGLSHILEIRVLVRARDARRARKFIRRHEIQSVKEHSTLAAE